MTTRRRPLPPASHMQLRASRAFTRTPTYTTGRFGTHALLRRAGVYVCPCYKTADRMGEATSAGFVMAVELPSADECLGALSSPTAPTFSPHWIKRGVALILAGSAG